MKLRQYIVVLLMGMTISLFSQDDNRFSASIIVGLNASQLDGDRSVGFNRLGPSIGIQGGTNITDKMQLNLEILYNNLGSQNEFLGTFNDLFKINLDYLELPVTLSYKDWLYSDGDDTYYKVRITLGASYRRLISAKLAGATGTLGEEFFTGSDVGYIISGGFQFKPSWGFEIRYTGGFGYTAYKFVDEQTGATLRMRTQFLSFRVIYSL